MNFLVIGDPHFKVSNIRETDEMHSLIIERLQANPVDFIVVLGDVLDRHETIHVSPLTRAVNFLRELSTLAPTYVLIGNHDLKNNRQFLSDEHPFVALKNWSPQLIIVDTTLIKVLHTQSCSPQTFVLVPYVPPGRFVEALDKVDNWQAATCIFAHQEFKGAHMGAIVSVEGDDWPLSAPLVISGHIHDYGEPQANIIYTGTPIQHTYSDHTDRSISQLTFKNVNERKHERVYLAVRHKEIIRCTCQELMNVQIPEGKDLKIIISGTTAEIKASMKHPQIEAWRKIGHKVTFRDLPHQSESSTESLTLVSNTRFSTLLLKAIESSPSLIKLYHEIFSN